MYRNLDRIDECSDSAIAIAQTPRHSAVCQPRIKLLSYVRNRSQRKAEEMQINTNRIDLLRYLSKGDSAHYVNLHIAII